MCWWGGTGHAGVGGGGLRRPTRPPPVRRHPFPRVFSACSRRQLRAFFRKGGALVSQRAGLRAPGAAGALQERLCKKRARSADCGAGGMGSARASPGDQTGSRSPPPGGLSAAPSPGPSLAFPAPESAPDSCCLGHSCSLRARSPVHPQGLLRALPGESVGGCRVRLGGA